MKTRLIRILGTVLSVFGVTATANAYTGVCYNPTAKYSSTTLDTNAVVKYKIDTGAAWFVGWPNTDYTGAGHKNFGANVVVGFPVPTFFGGQRYYVIGVDPALAYENVPELAKYCAGGVSSGVTAADIISGLAAENLCAKGGDGHTFYAAQSGVFEYYGCCFTGAIGTGTSGTGTSDTSGYKTLEDCPCIYRKADESGRYDSSYGEIVTHAVIPQIRTYQFINCSDGYYQPTDSKGNSEIVRDTATYSGITIFNIHPGFGWSSYYDFTDAGPCVIPGVGTSDYGRYCKNDGCTETGTAGWFGGYSTSSCAACPNSSSDVSGPSQAGELVFASTVRENASSSVSGLISTLGINSCKLARYVVTDSKGTIVYSCDSTYK